MVTQMSGRRNVRLGKCLSGKMFAQGSLHWGNVLHRGSVRLGEMSVRDLSLGKCQSGKCPVG